MDTIVLSEKHPDPYGDQRRECSEVVKRPFAEDLGEAIFPGGTTPNEQGAVLIPGEIKPINKHALTAGVLPIVIGCILYKFSFESSYHQTGFAYEIRKRVNLDSLDFKEGAVPIKDLTIIPWTGGSKAFFAN